MLLAVRKLLGKPLGPHRSPYSNLELVSRGIRIRRRSASITYVHTAEVQRIWAVKIGHVPGIYETAADSHLQTIGLRGGEWKCFAADLRPAAQAYIAGKLEKGPASSPSRLIAYTDGGFRGGVGGAGVYWTEEPAALDVSERLPATVKDAFVAELFAVLRALETDPCPTRPLSIYTDSAYVRETFSDLSTASTKVFGVWQQEWTADLMALIADHLQERPAPCEFRRAFSNLGEYGNEKADALATWGIFRKTASAERDFVNELAVRRKARAKGHKQTPLSAEQSMPDVNGRARVAAKEDMVADAAKIEAAEAPASHSEQDALQAIIRDKIARDKEEKRRASLQYAADRRETKKVRAARRVARIQDSEEKEGKADPQLAARKKRVQVERVKRTRLDTSQAKEDFKEQSKHLRRQDMLVQGEEEQMMARSARPKGGDEETVRKEDVRQVKRREEARGWANRLPQDASRLTLVQILRAQGVGRSQSARIVSKAVAS